MGNPDPLRSPDPEPVIEEERLLRTVLEAAAKERPTAWSTLDAQAQLVRLRDELVEERLAEDRASLLEQMDRVARLVEQQAHGHEGQLDVSSPYFGHMRLVEDEGGRRDILIGKRTWVKDGIRIVDWRNAPISKVFYTRREGDDFEIQIAGKEVVGDIVLRRTVSIRDGRVERVATRDGVFVRGPTGWVSHGKAPRLEGGLGTAKRPDRISPTLGTRGDGTGVREDKFLREIASLLDPEQFALITRPDRGIVAIQGSAGSGKTTVALHRVAWLNYQDPSRFAASRALIVLFSPALAAYIIRILPALGVEGVQVRIFEEWAGEMRRRLYPEAPEDYAENTPGAVARFKLCTGLLHMLEEGYLQNLEVSPIDLFDELFTNRDWIREGLARHAPGQFSETQQNEIHRWCSEQHFVRADGEGSREDDYPCYDHEDDAIILYLHQLAKGPLSGRKGIPIRYTQLVVDEAQDLSPIELQVLLGTVEKNGAVTLAGDVAQRVMENSDFRDWGQVLKALGHEDVLVSPLAVSYRSTGPIMRLAHDVLGPLAPPEPPSAPRDGVPPELFRFRSRGEMLTFVADAIRGLQTREPLASIALLGSREWQCDEAAEALRRADVKKLSRVKNYDFAFAPGVEVTDVRQSKGLEFDYVLLLDVDAESYPVTEAFRHLLHVGVTRAAHQLWLTSVGTPSALLPSWLQATVI